MSQRSVDNLQHIPPSGLVVQIPAYLVADIGHLNPLDAIVQDVGRDLHIVNVEDAGLLALYQHPAEQPHLYLIEVLAYRLHPPDVAEEACTQGPVAVNGLLDAL